MIIIKPKVNIILLFSVIAAAVCLFAFPELSLKGAQSGVELCMYSLIPSLFPFMALGTFIMRTNALYLPSKIFAKATEFFFSLPQTAGEIILLSLIGGYPVGAKLTSEALEKGSISASDAKRLCFFCINPGPAFTMTTLGIYCYGNAEIGIIIYISLCISSLILGVLTRFLFDVQSTEKPMPVQNSFSADDITFSVWNSFEAVLKICAWVILFSSFIACIKEKAPQSGEILCAFAEVSAGAISLSKICPVPAVTALCGFGGFCVHCQILKYLKACSLQYKMFFVGRILNSALSAAICHFILYFFPIELETSYSFSNARVSAISVSLPAAVMFVFMCISMIFNIDRKGKVC